MVWAKKIWENPISNRVRKQTRIKTLDKHVFSLKQRGKSDQLIVSVKFISVIFSQF